MALGTIRVCPIYLLLDVSASMRGDAISALNDTIETIVNSLITNPNVVERVHLGINIFSSGSEVVLPLTPLTEISRIPIFSAGGASDYGSAFRLMRTTIEIDLERLRSRQLKVIRPTIFFASDGTPTDPPSAWMAELDRLREPRWHPNIVAVGFSQADPQVLSRVATTSGGAFLVQSGASPRESMNALAAFVSSYTQALTASVMRSVPVAQVTVPANLVSVPLQIID